MWTLLQLETFLARYHFSLYIKRHVTHLYPDVWKMLRLMKLNNKNM
jgi:hypothetical protein